MRKASVCQSNTTQNADQDDFIHETFVPHFQRVNISGEDITGKRITGAHSIYSAGNEYLKKCSNVEQWNIRYQSINLCYKPLFLPSKLTLTLLTTFVYIYICRLYCRGAEAQLIVTDRGNRAAQEIHENVQAKFLHRLWALFTSNRLEFSVELDIQICSVIAQFPPILHFDCLTLPNDNAKTTIY